MKNSSRSEDEQEVCKYSDVDSLLPSKSRQRFRVCILLFFTQLAYSMVLHAINITQVETAFGKSKRIGNHTVTIKPPAFNWGSEKIAMLDLLGYGHFFYIVAGHVSQKFEGSAIVGVSILLNGVFTAATSFSAYCGFYPFLACQGLVQLFQCSMVVRSAMVFAHWIPTQERSLLMPTAIGGMYVGFTISHQFCEYLTQKWGWWMPSFATGGICVILAIFWFILVPNSPSNDDNILKGTGNPVLKKVHHPYKEIFKSVPFWALLMSHFAYVWAHNFARLYLDFFQHHVIRHHIKVRVFYIPNASIFIIPTASMLIWYWQNHSTLTKTQIYKTVVCAGYTVSAIVFAAFTAVPLANSSMFFSIVLSMLHFVKLPMLYSKLFLHVITIDMAPNYSGLIFGLIFFWRNVSFTFIDRFIYFLQQIHNIRWDMWLLSAAGVLFLNVIIFWMFGSCDPQPWSVSQTSNNENEPENEDLARRKIRPLPLEDTV